MKETIALLIGAALMLAIPICYMFKTQALIKRYQEHLKKPEKKEKKNEPKR